MGSKSLSVDVPADAEYLKCIRGFLRPVLESRFSDDCAQQLVLALDEACSNIIKHGKGWLKPKGRITLEIDIEKKKMTFRILSFCKEKEVEKIKPRDLDDIRPGGLGTHFIAEVMDTVDYVPDENKPGRAVLVMTKKISTRKDNEAES